MLGSILPSGLLARYAQSASGLSGLDAHFGWETLQIFRRVQVPASSSVTQGYSCIGHTKTLGEVYVLGADTYVVSDVNSLTRCIISPNTSWLKERPRS